MVWRRVRILSALFTLPFLNILISETVSRENRAADQRQCELLSQLAGELLREFPWFRLFINSLPLGLFRADMNVLMDSATRLLSTRLRS
jgi:hypothetical protein